MRFGILDMWGLWFAVLLTALLRACGVPARARCGFGTYFQGDARVDHWITEWWDDARERWVRTDPQIDDVQRGALKISRDTLDLAPRTGTSRGSDRSRGAWAGSPVRGPGAA